METNSNSKNLQWVGVLAGAYKAKNLSTRPMLNHVSVGRDGLVVGRIKRGAFDVLCRTVDADSLCDEGSKGTKRCEACEALVARYGLDVAEEVA